MDMKFDDRAPQLVADLLKQLDELTEAIECCMSGCSKTCPRAYNAYSIPTCRASLKKDVIQYMKLLAVSLDSSQADVKQLAKEAVELRISNESLQRRIANKDKHIAILARYIKRR